MSEEKPKTQNQSPIKYFISGGFGGICTVIVGVSLVIYLINYSN